MRFRDRDAPVTREGLIFRTYGYDHPEDACFCDLEYAPETVYRTDFPRAVRNGGSTKHYKFFFDGGLRFVKGRYPQYQLFNDALREPMVGVKSGQLARVVRPEKVLQELVNGEQDPLEAAVGEVVSTICDASALRIDDFGVFGSLAHGFYDPRYSDIDLIVYGMRELRELRATLEELYGEGAMRNEFDGWTADGTPHHWNFKHYAKEDYIRHQRRKLIYAVHDSNALGRTVKVEFEPVRKWEEIESEYASTERIEKLGRVEATVEVLSDEESGFMPSIYPVSLKRMSRDVNRRDFRRVVSFVEEFRLQIEAGETALVRGDLERVETREGQFHQIVLTYGPEYFDQFLRLAE